MAEAVYILCALTSGLCAVLLLRGYRSSRTRLLLWSGLCFVGLTLNNVLLFVDLIVVPAVDLAILRRSVAAVAMGMLIFGLVWEAKQP
jgi:hypothetical protein